MIAIELNNLTKIYRLYNSPKDRLRELINLTGRKFHHDFHALNDVSFTVKKGQTVGIIGQNGSGKSTLLKLISGVLQPSSGNLKVNGRISSLLELGAGFNPEFTGRENVYMNGALMGFNKEEMERRFPDIEAFAEIREFIDQPVKKYSSGMFMRLAFAAAINVDPDILIIDEILAVGDLNFQSKCLQKLQELRQTGKTILFVSHDLNILENICIKVYLLHKGKCLMEGKPSDVIPIYRRLLSGEEISDHPVSGKSDIVLSSDFKGIRNHVKQSFSRWGTKEVEITNVSFYDKEEQIVNGIFRTNEGFIARIEFIAHRKVNQPVFGIAIFSEDGTYINGSNTKVNNYYIPAIEGKGVIEYFVEVLPLLQGKYFFTASVSDYDIFVPYDIWHKCLYFTIVQSEPFSGQTGTLYLANKWHLHK